MGSDKRCRACLVQRRSLRSIFQFSGSRTYADMITDISNVKIHPNDGGPSQICLTCRSKTEEAYSFKTLVEQSNKHLCFDNAASDRVKRLIFDNVNDIKCEIDRISLGYPNVEDPIQHVKFEFDKDENEILYKNTVIKKLLKTEDTNETLYYQRGKSETADDFINNIKTELSDTLYEEADENDYCDEWSNDDFEYLPPGTEKHTAMHVQKKLKNKKKHIQKCKNGTQKSVNGTLRMNKGNVVMLSKKERIKPVYLKDYYVMKAKTEPHKRILKPRPTYVYPKRVCPYCGKVMKNLHTHLSLHTGEKKFKCKDCPKGFFKLRELEKHSVVHTGIKNFKCSTCDAAFYSRDALNRHLLCHKTVKDEVCNICSKAFRRKVTLRRHMIRHSSANKNVKCDLCNMTFYEKFNLQHHMRIHTGERPYKCELCSQPYSYKRDFDRHCLKKHGVYVQKRGIRIMNEELLQKERQDVRAALEGQQQNEAVHSISSTSSSAITDPTFKFTYPHLVDASQIRTLFNL